MCINSIKGVISSSSYLSKKHPIKLSTLKKDDKFVKSISGSPSLNIYKLVLNNVPSFFDSSLSAIVEKKKDSSMISLDVNTKVFVL